MMRFLRIFGIAVFGIPCAQVAAYVRQKKGHIYPVGHNVCLCKEKGIWRFNSIFITIVKLRINMVFNQKTLLHQWRMRYICLVMSCVKVFSDYKNSKIRRADTVDIFPHFKWYRARWEFSLLTKIAQIHKFIFLISNPQFRRRYLFQIRISGAIMSPRSGGRRVSRMLHPHTNGMAVLYGSLQACQVSQKLLGFFLSNSILCRFCPNRQYMFNVILFQGEKSGSVANKQK